MEYLFNLSIYCAAGMRNCVYAKKDYRFAHTGKSCFFPGRTHIFPETRRWRRLFQKATSRYFHTVPPVSPSPGGREPGGTGCGRTVPVASRATKGGNPGINPYLARTLSGILHLLCCARTHPDGGDDGVSKTGQITSGCVAHRFAGCSGARLHLEYSRHRPCYSFRPVVV